MKYLYQKEFWVNHCFDQKYQTYRDKIINAFKDLVFDEAPHKYYLHGKEMECVSNITHIFKPEFDTEIMAQATYERNYNNEKSKYYQMTVEEIKKQWKDISNNACTLGSERHEFGESCFYFMSNQFDKILPAFKDRLKYIDGIPVFEAQMPKEEAIVDFWNDIPISFIPLLAETKVFIESDNFEYSGTFDITFYYDPSVDGGNPLNEGIFIFDYKTNADLYKNFNQQKLLSPFDDLLDMSLNIYKLQLAAYQICLENIGFNIIGRRLIWLRNNGSYEKIALEDLSKQLFGALNEHFRH